MLTYIERKKLEVQDLKLGEAIYKLSSKHKDIGIFGDNEKIVIWIMSMFCGRKFNNANFYSPVCLQNKEFNDMNLFEAVIYVKIHWSAKNNEIKNSIKSSFEFGLKKFIPILQIDYYLKAKDDLDKTIYNILSDGISAWKRKIK